MPDELVRASDGLLARSVPAWSQEKLHYIDRYLNIFTTAMKDKWRLAYVDLFSGPGLCVVEDTSREILGSPLLAARQRYPFSELYLNDVDTRAMDALRQRLRGADAEIQLRALDCNEAASEARAVLEKPHTLGVALIDPTAFQIRFESIERMTRGLKVDLLITVMTGFIRRFMEDPGFIDRLDSFFGSTDWRSLIELREGGEQVTNRHLLDAYQERLRALGYIHVYDHVRITNSKSSTIYHLVFASKHERGAEFFQKISRVRFTGQTQMDLN